MGWMVEKLVPKQPNGHVDWLAYIRTGWPVIVAVICVVFWFGGRLESPEAKENRIKNLIHDNVPPDWLRNDVQDIKSTVRQNGKSLTQLHVMIDLMERRITNLEDAPPN